MANHYFPQFVSASPATVAGGAAGAIIRKDEKESYEGRFG
jgi:hypothetical protein